MSISGQPHHHPPAHLVHASEAGRGAATGPSDTFVASARKRLVAALLLSACIYGLYFVLFTTVWIDAATMVGKVSNITMIGLSLLLAFLLSRRPPDRRVVVAFAMVFHFAMAWALTLSEYSDLPAFERPLDQISWNCVNILLLPLLVPAAPRTILVTAAILALTNPIAFAITVPLAGHPMPDMDVFSSLMLPPFACAVIAYVPSLVIHNLHRDLSEARQMGSYELIDKLGGGGMGEVWRARHRMLVRPAAVKLIKPELLAQDQETALRTVHRFEREAQATALLESPHTVELYDFGVADDGTFYCVMELLRGIDLQTLVDEFGPLPPARVVHVLRQVCDSLEDAHRNGLVHRDVKPANLFVSRRANRVDWVKVLDFGLVKVQEIAEGASGSVGVTMEGQIQGTPAYLAPEALVGDDEPDHRVDIYALGCVAYYLLTGELVFDRATPMRIAVAHATEEPVPPSRRSEQEIPEDLERLVLACLAKAPDDRPTTARELEKRLEECSLPDTWDDERAERWWRDHLPEHSRDLRSSPI